MKKTCCEKREKRQNRNFDGSAPKILGGKELGTVEFRVAVSYPGTGIKDGHFILEFFPIQLKLEIPL